MSDAAGQPALQARYVWGEGLAPLAMWRKLPDGSVKLFFHLSDGQESVRQLTDASGGVVDSYFYDAWGNTLDGSSHNVVNPFRYTGQQLDADGKYYLRARFYNPGTGRFLSHDPLMGDGSDPASLHRYLYAGADGVDGCDPSGDTTLVEIVSTVCTWSFLHQKEVTTLQVGANVIAALTLPDEINEAINQYQLMTAPVTGAGAPAGQLANKGIRAEANAIWRARLSRCVAALEETGPQTADEVMGELRTLRSTIGRPLIGTLQKGLTKADGAAFYDARTLEGTMGKLVINGQSFWDMQGAGIARTILQSSGATQQTLMHTEGNVFAQAAQAGLKGISKEGILYLDRAPCDDCLNIISTNRASGGLAELMKYMGMQELKLVYPSGSAGQEILSMTLRR